MKKYLQTKTTPHKASLPSIKLHKDKKYYRPQQNQENALQHDLDGFIVKIAPGRSCSSQYILKHFSSQQRLDSASVCSPCVHWEQIKQLRGEISKYIQQMGKAQSSKEGDYMQFVRLSRESQDYLEYYIRNHFKQSELGESIQCTDQAVILSLLKNNYPCLTENSSDIVSRILLSFSINPLNDFHLVPWTTFAAFRKLAVLKQTKSESRQFLVNYLMGGKRSIGGKEFWSMIGGVLRKLKVVISERNVERLLDRVVSVGEWVPEEMGKEDLQRLMTSYWYFLWEQIVRLILIV